MANEIEQTTLSADGETWVDVIPSKVSTGYQTQNTAIQAHANGEDKSHARVENGNVIVDISGPIDIKGVPFSVKSAVTLAVLSDGTFYIKIINGTTDTQKSLVLTNSAPIFDAELNGYYITEGSDKFRVLNWVVTKNTVGLRVDRPTMGVSTLNAVNVNAENASIGEAVVNELSVNNATGNFTTNDPIVFVQEIITVNVGATFDKDYTLPVSIYKRDVFVTAGVGKSGNDDFDKIASARASIYISRINTTGLASASVTSENNINVNYQNMSGVTKYVHVKIAYR